MIVKAISLNVRGLNDPRKTDRLRHYFQELQGGIDVILIQEHKLRGDKATNLGKLLFPKGKSWTLQADAGYNILGLEGGGKGGICTIINQKLAPFVSSHGSILRN